MPEDQEVETEKLHEAIKEQMEKEGGAFLRRIALTTAVLAALAAVASLWAGSTVNEALVLKAEVTQLQAEISDQWAYYQAKGIKAAVQRTSESAWAAQGKTPPADLEEKAKRYDEEQKEIESRAHEREKERDQRSHEAEILLHRHHSYANAVAFFQVSIALGAVAALTRQRPVWVGSIVVGLVGLVFLTRLLG
jgi:hypothetical protein